MIKKLFIIACVLAVIGAAAGGALYYVYPVQVSIFAALTRNYFISWLAPAGTATTEANAAYKGDPTVAAATPVEVVASVSTAQAPSPGAAAGDCRATTGRSLLSATRRSTRSIRRMSAW